MATKGMRCKWYTIRKKGDDYEVTFKDTDWTSAGTIQIPASCVDRSGYAIHNRVINNTTSYYADQIAEAIQRDMGLRQ